MALAEAVNSTVAAYFDSRTEAARAVEALKDAGFSSAHLGMAHSGSTDASHTEEPGMWNKIKGFFGEESEPYADERTQGDLANREVTANPADEYAESYGTDLSGSFQGMNVPEERSRYFGHKLSASDTGAVVTVKAGDRYDEAASILTRLGGDIGESAAAYEYPAMASAPATEKDAQRIQLLGEVLRVHKDRVSRGEVTLRKETITEMQTVQVPVTREELVIERRAVTGSEVVDGSIGDGQTIRVPLTEEVASLDKSTVVREEVSVGKRAVGEVSDLSDEVRREELVVDDQTTTTATRR